MWFIDYLSVHQDYDKELPIVGSEMITRYDLQTGEQISCSPKSLKHEGSHSSSITIRCNGSRVSIQGNPSRWERADNLFGFTTFRECIQVYNQILARFDLPIFTPCSTVFYRQGEDGSRAQLVSDGAVIDHVDFTRNFAVGQGNEEAFLRGLSSQSIGKGHRANLYANQQTVDWRKGSTLQYDKVYKKAFDLIKHKKTRLLTASPQEVNHYERLIDWCNEIGLLREEHSFKRAWLARKKLSYYGLVKESDFEPYLKDIERVIERLEVMNTRYETISDQLLDKEVVKSRQAANATQAMAFQWLHGMPLSKNTQYYDHRRRLLQIGIDIAIPHDVTRLAPQFRSTDIIDVGLIEPPSWYRLPSAGSHLSLVGC
jgi:hypothetical protein